MTTSLPMPVQTPLSVRYRPIDALRPDPGNARTHSRSQIEQIVASIRNFGFANPILVTPDDVIIAGHGRLIAARQAGLAEVPTIALSALSEAQVRALRIADNKIALNAGWDVDLLKAELAGIAALDVSLDLELTGFSTGEIDVILNPGEDPADDDIPALPTTPVTQLGDIWVLGPHRIGCGDGRDKEFLERVMGVTSSGALALADAAFLDPPYNVRINGHANARGRHREFAMASGEMSDDVFRAFLAETLGASAAVTRQGGIHFICMDWRHLEDVAAVGRDIYGAFLNLCVWNKSNAGMGSLYRSKHELVFIYRIGQESHRNNIELGRHGRNRTNVWDYASVNSLRGSRHEDLEMHPTVKPTAMVADAIRDVTARGEIVLDIFLGSGTTLIAAERAGRHCRGIDLDPAYVDLAVRRWQDLTGGEPVLERNAAKS